MQYFGVMDIITPLRYQLNIVQSRSLPYPSKNFVGRQEKLEELTEYISFSNDNFLIVNVIGAPGIGKSTLAIHVGHKMIAAGVAVHYVDIAELPSEQVLQVLAEKILESAQIVTDKVGNFDRLLKWSRQSYWNNLLILDNCDDALNYQKEEFQRGIERIVQESMNIKVLMTSREISLHLDYLKQLKVYELTLESACDLLIEKIPVEVNLTSENRETIAKLTGRIPLALQVIASLLTLPSPPSPEEIIQELKKHPIETLSHDKLPQNRQVNASFSLSYNYLSKKLQIIGSYVANFPGSFTKEAAIYSCGHLVHGTNQRDIAGALRSLVDRSLLEHSTRMDRFHYHRLIREFFHFQTINKNSSSESFFSGFHWHYSIKLYEFAMKFNMNHKPSLAFLDTERHNIQLLLDNLAMQKINERDEFIAVITAVAAALDFDLLNCRFSGEELLEPLHCALIHLDQHLKVYMAQLSLKSRKLDCDYEHQITYTAHRMVCTYETLIHNLAEIENQLHGPEMALRVYSDRKDIMEDIKQPWNMGSYIEYLRRLAHYYQILGHKDEEIGCHKRITDHSLRLAEIFCKKETECKYVHVAKMYASLSNHREAAHFYELSLLKEHHHNVIHKAEILCELCKIYEHLYLSDKAKEFFEKLISLYSEIMNAPASLFLRYSSVVWNVIHVYNQYQKYHEAAMLQEKILDSLLDIGTIRDKQTLRTGIDAVRKLFHSRNYEKSIQTGQRVLELLAREKDIKDINVRYIDATKQEIKILIGRAKIHNGDFSAGLDELETAYINLTFISKLYNGNMICKYLIFRPLKYFDLCTTLNLGPYTIIVFGQTFLYLLFVAPLAIDSKQIALHFYAKLEQPIVTSMELVTVRSELEMWDFFTQMQLRTYIEQLIYGYTFGIIEFCMKSVVLRLVINIASVFFRLWMLYVLCKFMLMLSRFANQYRCVCFFITILASLFLCLFLAVFVLPLYLLYLHRIR